MSVSLTYTYPYYHGEVMRLLAVLFLLHFHGIALSQEPALLKNFETRIDKLRLQAKSAIRRIESEAAAQRKQVGVVFDEQIEKIRKEFLEKAEEVQIQATKDGDLDSAIAARDGKEKIAVMKVELEVAKKSPKDQEEKNTTGTGQNRDKPKVNKLTAIDFEGAWVNQIGLSIEFRADGTWKTAKGAGGSWKYDPTKNTFQMVEPAHQALLYNVHANGIFIDGVGLKGPNAGKRVWMVKIR